MPFRVVAKATRFIGRPTHFDYEQEALTPLGVTIEAFDAATEDEYIAKVRDADAIIAGGQALNARVLGALERAKIIAFGGIGVDSIDLDAATEKDILITNVPDLTVPEVASQAMTLLLCCARKAIALDRTVREGRWDDSPALMPPLARMAAFTDEVLGLVPFGNIPRAVAKRAQAFDMKVIAWDPFVSDDAFAQAGVERVASLQDVFRRADFVSCHMPLTPKTRGLFDWSCFEVMKPTAYFVNIGRGPTHVEADLIRALQEGRIAGAGLDVFEHEPTAPDNPLLAMENVVFSPHMASVSDRSMVLRCRRMGEEIAAVLQGRLPRFVVNKEAIARVALPQPS
jgi:D-3-phosphoglycerate dehydrogenase